MKKTQKLFSVLLVICMLLATCLMAVSCSKVKEKDFEKNPSEALEEALSNTYSDFFEDDLGIGKVLKKADERSAVQIYFENEGIKDIPVTRLGATVYSDVKNERYVLDGSVTYEGKELSARAYWDQKSVTLSGSSLFGNDGAYAVYLDTLIEKLKGSPLAEMLKLSDEDAEEMKTLLAEMKKDAELSKKKDEEQYRATMKALYAKLQQKAEDEKIQNAAGKEINCVAVGFVINNATIEEVVTYLIETQYGGVIKNMMDEDESISDLFVDMNEDVEISISAKLYLEKKTNKIVKVTVEGYVKELTDLRETTEINATLMISDSKITLAGAFGDFTMDISLEKKTEGKDVSYSLIVYAGEGGAMINLLNATLSLKKDGTLSFSADAYNELKNASRTAFTATGTFRVERKSVAFEINEVKAGDVMLKLKLGIQITADPEIPEVPANSKDIVTMTREEWEQLMKDMEKSPFGKLIGGLI